MVPGGWDDEELAGVGRDSVQGEVVVIVAPAHNLGIIQMYRVSSLSDHTYPVSRIVIENANGTTSKLELHDSP